MRCKDGNAGALVGRVPVDVVAGAALGTLVGELLPAGLAPSRERPEVAKRGDAVVVGVCAHAKSAQPRRYAHKTKRDYVHHSGYDDPASKSLPKMGIHCDSDVYTPMATLARFRPATRPLKQLRFSVVEECPTTREWGGDKG